jgi:hypothetical protein
MDRKTRWLARRVERRIVQLVIAILLTAGTGIAVATSASAATVTPAQGAIQSVSSAPSAPSAPVQHQVTTKYGTLTYGWQPLTGEARDSASGCNQDVCIEIVGTSNHVTDWDTQAYWNGGAKCTRARYLANGRQILLGSVICGSGAGVFYWYWTPNRYFPSPTLACNQWTAIPGYPCETITR